VNSLQNNQIQTSHLLYSAVNGKYFIIVPVIGCLKLAYKFRQRSMIFSVFKAKLLELNQQKSNA